MGFTPKEEEKIRKVMGFPSEEKAVLRDLFGINDISIPHAKLPESKILKSIVFQQHNDVEAIYVTESIKRVVVLFKDGTKEIVDCGKDDNFDVIIGVALAISNHLFKSKTQFHKFVTKKAKYIEKVEKANTPKKIDARSKFKGTTWVHRKKKNKRVPVNELDVYFSNGWEKGKYRKEKK